MCWLPRVIACQPSCKPVLGRGLWLHVVNDNGRLLMCLLIVLPWLSPGLLLIIWLRLRLRLFLRLWWGLKNCTDWFLCLFLLYLGKYSSQCALSKPWFTILTLCALCVLRIMSHVASRVSGLAIMTYGLSESCRPRMRCCNV